MYDTNLAFTSQAQATIPIHAIIQDGYPAWLEAAEPRHRAYLSASGFKPKAGKTCLLPGGDGGVEAVLACVSSPSGRWAFAGLPSQLGPGTYRIENLPDAASATHAALAWGLGHYRFDRYRKAEPREAMLAWPEQADHPYVEAALEAVTLVRDLVNTPASDLGPGELADAAIALAQRFGADGRVIVGEDLLQENYPAIHTVGRAHPRAPRLIDFSWGDPTYKAVTLVGKGVTFDTGGLDIKPGTGMVLMKKDMGGAAHALGLALMVMRLNLKLRLRVLIPAVENSIAGDAMRPSDVIRMRNGMTVEVGNTDAEGRLVLADALVEACAGKPSAIIDFATLTGAARTALGPDLPALFCNDETMASGLLGASAQTQDPVWRLPLWQPYAEYLDSSVADINNNSNSPMAGAIAAALFMERFVTPGQAWAHFDVYAWMPSTKPGRPVGSEAYGLHACFEWLRGMASPPHENSRASA
jgi:leucyl aminopeptidase